MSNILPVPHFRQLNDGYCLPACTQMVLAYWGIQRDQAVLAQQLYMLPGAGTPGSRLRLLASPQLEVFYGEGTFADLEAAVAVRVPPIVLVHTNQLPYWQQAFAHAVVVIGIEGTGVVLHDTAVRVSRGDFELAWDEMANLYGLLRKK
ncbi:MAG: C39 family peptidase [Anaerolineae bacterium]|nr:C39 family peptidase [Anaerolineae bacterium]